MQGEKIEQAKKSCIDIFESLTPRDHFSVLAFDDEVVSVVNPQTPRNAVKDRILALEPRGQTNLSKGWYLGLLELQTYATDKHINRLVLLSDGQANQGEQKPSVLGAESSRARDEANITTSTIGIGTDFQEEILAALARHSGGRFWFMGETRIEDIIKEEFSGALSVLLERPAISIDLPVGVSVARELNDVQKFSGRYRPRPIKANDQFGLALRLSVDPAKVDDSKLLISGTLFDGAGIVQRTELSLPLVPVDQYVQSREDPRVEAIISKYRAAASDEEMVKKMDEGNTSVMLDMLQAESALMKELEKKLAGASAITWEDEEARAKAEIEDRLNELRMEIEENKALHAVVQLIDLIRGLGQTRAAARLTRDSENLMVRARKMAKQKGMRGMGHHGRSSMEDWAPRVLLEEAKQVADSLAVDYPGLRTELQTIRRALDEQLAHFSQ